MTRGNPSNYPLATLAELASRRRTAEITLRRQLEEELRRGLLAVQMEFEKELLTARQAGVGVSLLADTTGYSRPYMYEVLKKAGAGGWFVPEPIETIPHSDIYTLTGGGEGMEVKAVLPEGIEVIGYVGLHPQQGWLFGPRKGIPAYDAVERGWKPGGGQREALEEWADATWPADGPRPTHLEMDRVQRQEYLDRVAAEKAAKDTNAATGLVMFE